MSKKKKTKSNPARPDKDQRNATSSQGLQNEGKMKTPTSSNNKLLFVYNADSISNLFTQSSYVPSSTTRPDMDADSYGFNRIPLASVRFHTIP